MVRFPEYFQLYDPDPEAQLEYEGWDRVDHGKYAGMYYFGENRRSYLESF